MARLGTFWTRVIIVALAFTAVVAVAVLTLATSERQSFERTSKELPPVRADTKPAPDIDPCKVGGAQHGDCPSPTP